MLLLPLQEVFELRYAKMPEEPPAPVEKTAMKTKMAGTSESSDQSNSDESDSSSSDESESESERASQLSYLQKQVREQLLEAKRSQELDQLCTSPPPLFPFLFLPPCLR